MDRSAATTVKRMITPEAFRQALLKEGIERTVQTIRRWCERGLPGAIFMGGQWEIPEETITTVVAGGWDCRK